jgi:D-amino-acid dehydrogenase
MKIAVIGAGIVGVSTAEWLRRSDHEVTLIDRQKPGEGASFGNAGLLARGAVLPVPGPGTITQAPAMLLSKDKPLFLKWPYLPRLLPWLIPYLATSRRDQVIKTAGHLAPLVTDTVDQHKALAAGTPAERWIRDTDSIYLLKNAAAFKANTFGWNLRQQHGIEGEILSANDLKDNDPALGDAYQFGYKLARSGFIANPGRYVKDLAAWFIDQGGKFVQAEVDIIQASEQGATVLYGGETKQYDRLIVATGAWSGKLSRQLGIKTKLESERGYHVQFTGASHTPPVPYLVSDAKCAVTPMDEGLRVAGIVEFGGLTASPSAAPVNLLLKNMKELYPDFTYETKSEWMGHRPSTVDSLPVLGCSTKAPGIYFVYGHQHIGMTAGAKSGRLMAQMISGTTPNIDMTVYSPDRFS